MAQVCRVPFGEVSGDRLKELASVKNRQNAISATPAKPSLSAQAGKRSYDMSMLDLDSENVDPSAGAKKSKPSFSFTPILSTPVPSLPSLQSHYSQAQSEKPRSILRTPAGRSPKRQSRSLFAKSFRRIDPPFATSSSALPFSLDAALKSTVSSSSSSSARPAAPSNSKWQFAIYEDTPEEEAATVMEHSTLTLDLSSDDEGLAKKSDRGKENVAPEGYAAPARRSRRTAKTEVDIVTDQDEATAPSGPLVELPESEVPVSPIEELSKKDMPPPARPSTVVEQPSTDVPTQVVVSSEHSTGLETTPPVDTKTIEVANALEAPAVPEKTTEAIVIFEDVTSDCVI